MKLKTDASKCTGCRICESFCAFKKHKVVQPSRANIQIERQELQGIFRPLVCRHCAKPACLAACTEKALIAADNGVVELKPEKCIRCGSCMKACPFGVLFEDPVDGTPMKCNLCQGDPECARMCPSGAVEITGQRGDEDVSL